MPTSTIGMAPVETSKHENYNRLIAAAKALPTPKVAVAHPCDEAASGVAMEATALGNIEPIVVGPRVRIAAVAAALGADITAFRVPDVEHSYEAGETAAALMRAGEVEALMKDNLLTDEPMAAVVRHDGGLRTARRISLHLGGKPVVASRRWPPHDTGS